MLISQSVRLSSRRISSVRTLTLSRIHCWVDTRTCFHIWIIYSNRCGSVPGKYQSYPWFTAGEVHWCWNYWQIRQLYPRHSLQTDGNTLLSHDFELSSCTVRADCAQWMVLIFALFLADDFTPGAVLFGHPSQCSAEELLLSGWSTQKPFQWYWRYLFKGQSTLTLNLSVLECVPSLIPLYEYERRG